MDTTPLWLLAIFAITLWIALLYFIAYSNRQHIDNYFRMRRRHRELMRYAKMDAALTQRIYHRRSHGRHNKKEMRLVTRSHRA